VALGATCDADLAARSTVPRVTIGEPSSTGTWMLNCRVRGRASAEGTWQACRGPICAAVCTVICIAARAASRKVRRRASFRAGSSAPSLAPASGCCRLLMGQGRFPAQDVIRFHRDCHSIRCSQSPASGAGFLAANGTNKLLVFKIIDEIASGLAWATGIST